MGDRRSRMSGVEWEAMDRAILVGLACIALFACGDDPDNWPEGRPKISKLTYLQQTPDDPFMLSFAIDFEDTDGDLGGGQVLLFTNGSQNGELAAGDVFANQRPALALTSTVGELEVAVGLPHDIGANERVEIGFVLQDAKGNESNDPSVTLMALAPGGG